MHANATVTGGLRRTRSLATAVGVIHRTGTSPELDKARGGNASRITSRSFLYSQHTCRNVKEVVWGSYVLVGLFVSSTVYVLADSNAQDCVLSTISTQISSLDNPNMTAKPPDVV